MAEKLGALFLNAAMGPLNYAGQCIMQRRVEVGINELAADSLLGAVERGITTVAQAAGLPPSYVANLLPMNEIRQLAARIAVNQKVAMEQWAVHTGHIGGLLDGVADLTIDNRPPDASLCLLRVSKKMQLDKQLAMPLRQLSDDLDTWQELIKTSRTFIDDGRSLAAAYRQRKLVRIGIAVAVLLAVAVVVVWVVRVKMARDRVDVVLANEDPCFVAVSDGDLAKATDGQRATLKEREESCAAEAERVRVAEEAKRKEAERIAEARRKVEEQKASCEKLIASVAAGELDEEALRLAVKNPEPLRARLSRLASGKIVPDDVAKMGPLPCPDAKATKKVAERYADAVFATAAVWMLTTSPSKDATALIRRGRASLSARQLTIFDRHVEDIAKRAVRGGDMEKLAHVQKLCALKKALEIRVGQYCEAADAILSKPGTEGG